MGSSELAPGWPAAVELDSEARRQRGRDQRELDLARSMRSAWLTPFQSSTPLVVLAVGKDPLCAFIFLVRALSLRL